MDYYSPPQFYLQAFSYSEKDTIKKELNKVKSTNVKFEPRVQKKLKKPC
jgi:hypothetical protein